MKSSLSLSLILVLSTVVGLAYAVVFNNTLSIAELSVHRIDRLVTLKKIDLSFAKNISKLEITSFQNQDPALYKVLVSSPTSEKPLRLLMTFDKNGKALAFEVIAGGVASFASSWPGVDDVTLVENSLHYLLDNPNDINVAPIYKEFKSLELTKVTLSGKPAALAHMINLDGTHNLDVYLKADGSFNSAESVA